MKHIKDTLVSKERIFFEDPEESAGFTKASNLTLYDTNISGNAFRLLLILKNYGWKKEGIFPGQGRLAEDLKVSDRQIRRFLEELRDTGYLKWDKRGMGQTNSYTILKKWKNHTPIATN